MAHRLVFDVFKTKLGTITMKSQCGVHGVLVMMVRRDLTGGGECSLTLCSGTGVGGGRSGLVVVAGGDLICSVFCFYNLFLQNNIRKRQEISINKISRYVASFNLWSMEWSRKVGTENLDSGDAKVTQIFLLKKK